MNWTFPCSFRSGTMPGMRQRRCSPSTGSPGWSPGWSPSSWASRPRATSRSPAPPPNGSVPTCASGGISSDSERDLSIGGVGAVPLDLFDGFGYTALGHLHGRQELSPAVRYSGSPLAYSFSEAKHQKGGWLIDVDATGVTDVTEVLWGAPRQLAVLRGTLEELLAAEEFGWAEGAYCQVTLTDPQRPTQAMERLRARFPDTLVLGSDPQGAEASAKTSYSSRLAQAGDDLSICCGFLEHVRGRAADEAESAVLADALEAVRLEGVSR